MIGVGNGSDQILDLILSNFASEKTKVLTSNPTFGFFEERCKLYNIPLIAIPFSNEMKLNVEDFLKQLKNQGKKDFFLIKILSMVFIPDILNLDT